MSNVGGSANINGILYQILGTLDKALRLNLERTETNSDDILQARLIVEPIDGGDVSFGSKSGRIVQQWKAKTKGGTWSLSKIIEDVLPDLYLAVPSENLDAGSMYEFVTEGKRGDWDAAYELFQSLPNQATIGILDVLSQSPQRHKIGKSNLSDRGLFQHIVQVIRRRDEAKAESEQLTMQKVLHLLKRFVMDSPVNKEQIVTRINEFLRQHVEIAEDVDGKRCELCGVLLEAAAEGDRSITAEWLFGKANIPLHSFRDWPRLQRRLRSRLQDQLRKEQYDRSLDVRPSSTIQRDVTIITGESGQGKTWRLARAASDLSESESLVVWVPSWRGTADVAKYVAREIWNFGLGRDAQLTLDRIAARRQESNPTVKSPWLIACVDDVRTLEEAQFLQNLDWGHWGISLVMSTTPDVAEKIALRFGSPSLPTRDFDHAELRSFLERRSLSWGQIVHDVRELIRRPILAKVYADIASGESGFNPRTEYDLMEAAWQRISNTVDRGLVRSLAGTIQQEIPTYPWPSELVLERGGTAEAVKRLISDGWFRDSGDGNVAAWHHRFLQWAYANFLVAELNSGKITIERLGEMIGQHYQRPQPGRFHLGYVPMDVLWLLLTSNSQGRRPELWQLIAALESYEGLTDQDKSLYRRLLSSLGAGAVPLLIDRTRNSGEEKQNAIPKRAAEALLLIGRHYPDAVSDAAKDCLASDHVALRQLGLRLATAFPDKADPERLWNIYRNHIVSEKKDAVDYLNDELAGQAFRTVAGRHPAWLKQKLQNSAKAESCFTTLVFTLGNLGENQQAREIWYSTKDSLFQAIASDKRRCLIACITNFSDSDEYRRLEEWSLSDEELVGSAASLSLSYRVPKSALKILGSVPVNQLLGSTSDLGRALFAALPHDTCDAVERLLQERPEGTRAYVDILSEHGDRLSPSIVSELLDWLDGRLLAYLDAPGEKGKVPVHHPLDVVEGLHGMVVLEELRKRRGSLLEKHLVAFARSRIPRIVQWVDREFNQARDLLKRIAGDGFTELTNALIAAKHRQLRLEGCEAAVVRPNDETRAQLRKEAVSDEMWDSGASRLNLVQMRAIDSLAALGEGKGLVEGILKWGLKVSPYIADLREGKSPIPDEHLGPALELLKQPDSPNHANAILAVGQSGRIEFQEQIENLLLGSAFDSAVAQACLFALEDLVNNCDRILERLILQYRSGHFKFGVLKVLGRCGAPGEVYLKLLSGASKLDDMDHRVVRFLAGNEKTRSMIEPEIRRLVASERNPLNDTVDLLDPRNDGDRDLLWQKSLQPDRGFHTIGAKSFAIRKLGAVAPDAAFEIGLDSLLTDRRDRDSIPHVLMQLAPERAISELCRVVGLANDTVLCAVVGRAFRENATPAQLRSQISSLLKDANWRCRRAGAFVAGFLGQGMLDEELLRVAYGDCNWSVCREAQLAIRSQQRETEATKLAATLNSIAPTDVWGTIDCIIALTDPVIVTLPSDPIGFLKPLKALPYVVRKYASERIKRRNDRLEKDITSTNRKWGEDD